MEPDRGNLPWAVRETPAGVAGFTRRDFAALLGFGGTARGQWGLWRPRGSKQRGLGGVNPMAAPGFVWEGGGADL